MADYASEQGHWYDPKTGEARYTYLNAKGEEKNTTLREARKNRWVPSVTMIVGIPRKYQLENWKVEQGILAALTLPRREGEADLEFLARVKADSKEQAEKAATRGTQIHGWIQQGFETLAPPEGLVYYESAKKEIFAACGEVKWICEKSFATPLYGGKCDLHSDDCLIDIKTTDKDVATLRIWPEHEMQLAAYDRGLGKFARVCGILFVNSKTAEAKLAWAEPKRLSNAMEKFNHLLLYWYADTGF